MVAASIRMMRKSERSKFFEAYLDHLRIDYKRPSSFKLNLEKKFNKIKLWTFLTSIVSLKMESTSMYICHL